MSIIGPGPRPLCLSVVHQIYNDCSPARKRCTFLRWPVHVQMLHARRLVPGPGLHGLRCLHRDSAGQDRGVLDKMKLAIADGVRDMAPWQVARTAIAQGGSGPVGGCDGERRRHIAREGGGMLAAEGGAVIDINIAGGEVRRRCLAGRNHDQGVVEEDSAGEALAGRRGVAEGDVDQAISTSGRSCLLAGPQGHSDARCMFAQCSRKRWPTPGQRSKSRPTLQTPSKPLGSDTS